MSEHSRPTASRAPSIPTTSSIDASSPQVSLGRRGVSLPVGYLQHYGLQLRRVVDPASQESERGRSRYEVQRRTSGELSSGTALCEDVRAAAARGVSGAGGALPHLERIQQAFGPAHDLSGVRAHVGGVAARASEAIGAEAYATGDQVAFRDQPGLHLAAHEAAHVVQQRAGVQLKGGIGSEGDPWERHADAVADRVADGRPAGDLLRDLAGGGGVTGVQMNRHRATPVDPALLQQAQHDAEELVRALAANDEAAIRCVLGQDPEALRRVRTAYEATGGRRLAADVIARTQGALHTFAVSQLTRLGAAAVADLGASADASNAAMHDGGDGHALGQGDEVFDANNRIIAVFPSTAAGVVVAAQYELHRGERRSLAEIMADDSADRTQRGPAAAIEDHANNRDPQGAQTIGHFTRTRSRRGQVQVTESALGPISAYRRATGGNAGVAWCGSFATYVYNRAGIRVESMGWTHNVPDVLARAGSEEQHGAYYRFTGTEGSGGGHRYDGCTLQEGEFNPPSDEAPTRRHPRGRHRPGGARFHDAATQPTSALDFDMRPGDVFWMEHNPTTGHAGIVIGVHKTSQALTFVTIEGNASQMVRTHVRHIRVDTRGRVTSDVKGWGRPPELNAAAPQPNAVAQQQDGMPPWMGAAAAHEDGSNQDR